MNPYRTTCPVLLALALVAGAFAQSSSPAQSGTVEMEAFTVTGSNIKGVDTEKTLPVTVITGQDIKDAGFGSLAEVIEAMPYSANVSINETTTGPNDARGDVSTINLRNLGAGRTLVLLNGRRLSAYGVTPGTPPVQFVNVNAIPFGAVQQVEVLRDGASAVYGSDAIGGVVNTILKQDYDGFQADARLAFGDPAPRERNFSVAGGKSFNGDRSNLSLFFSYYDRTRLMAADRAYAATADKRPVAPAPFNTNSALNRASTSGPYGRFTALTDSGSGVSVSGVTSATGLFYYDPVTGARAAGAGPTAWYNSQNNAVLLPEITRRNLFGTFEHKLTNAVSLFSELSYYDARSAGGFDAIPISSGTDGIVIPKTNYYNPVGTRYYGPGTANPTGTPRNVLMRNYRVTEGGARSYDTKSDSYRILAGLRGTTAESTWNWETAGMYMRGTTTQTNHGYISVSRFLQQLALATPDAYNPFGTPGSNPESVVNNFLIDIWDRGVGTLASWDARASGEVYRLPGGPISVAFGGEVRRESMEQRNDPFGLNDDVVAQSEQLDVDASRSVYAGFGEILVPVVGKENRRPLLDALELRVAGRYEHYRGFEATKPGFGISWRPTPWLLLRGSYNEGFRAPSVVELYTPAIGRRNEGIFDTARSGQPDAVTNVSKRIVTGGNPSLNPEESKSWNAGAVVDVAVVKGLSFGVDLYRIREFSQIDNSDAQDELDRDAELWAAGHGSNPRVVREAQSPADVSANVPGLLVEVLSTYHNLTLRETEGADVFVNYRSPKWDMGRFNFSGGLNYVRKLRSIDEQGNVSDLVRNDGSPRIHATASVSWSLGNWSASILERYTSDYLAPTFVTTNGIRYVMDSYLVTNASVGFRFGDGALKGFRVRVGMNNVFDEAPPFYPASTAGYDTSYADPRGRMSYVDLSYRF